MLLNRPPLHEVTDRVAEHYDVFLDGLEGEGGASDYPAYALEAIGDRAFANRDWRFAWRVYADALRTGSILIDQRKCLIHSGRCALYLNETAAALSIFSEFVETFPDDAEGLFYLGRSFQRVHRYFDALNCLSAARELDPENATVQAATAQIAHALAFRGFGHTDGARSGTYLAVAEAGFARALQLDEANFEALTGRLMFRLDCGRVEDAVADFAALVEAEGAVEDERLQRAAINLALALARAGHLEALQKLDYLASFPAGERILARNAALLGQDEPGSPRAAPGRTVLHRDTASGGWMAGPCRDARWPGTGAAPVSDPWSALSVSADWVVPLRTTHWAGIRQLVDRLAGLPEHFAGIATFRPDAKRSSGAPAVSNLVVRKSSWDELIASQPAPPTWQEATGLALRRLRLYAHSVEPAATGAPGPAGLERPVCATDRVLVLSRHGPRRLGGGEQFLSDAARAYAGHARTEVVFAGLSTDPVEILESWPASNGCPAEGFLPDDPEALRAFCLRNAVTAIHTLSGLGEMVLDAVAGLDISVIYGVHFWREFTSGATPSRPWYPDIGRTAPVQPDPAFDAILSRADFAYVNSDYCRDAAVGLYNWRAPVLYSVPRAAPPDDPAPRHAKPIVADDHVLLANSRADKGWYLFLAMAEALPGRAFVAIAGQSDIEAARADVQHRGLFNVTVVERTEQMDAVYRAARVVVVPSFTFVETFSRVAIEAGRHGKPVLLADAGNLSRLGAGTSLLLPEEPAAWIDAVDRLFEDRAFCARLTRQSVALSERFDHEALMADLARLPITAGSPRLLVCVGSGIGNVCHTTPMIGKLADHFGCRIDVLVAGDFSGTGAVLAGAPQVGSVFEDYVHVRWRAYDRVFVTHSFGSVVPAFNAPRVHVSRDGEHFDPAGDLHEAEFNLAFLERTLGIDYTPDDVNAYFLGGWSWSSVADKSRAPRVALHAGSKDGVWAAKRWPHFTALAGALAREGVEVVSLGVAEEYVPGSIDKTGLSIERMTDELTVCDALVTNDSGVMNIANALGMPVLALFAPTNPATRAPVNSRSIVLTPDTDCTPCEARPGFTDRFRQGTCRCIGLISPARVKRALAELGLPVTRSAE